MRYQTDLRWLTPMNPWEPIHVRVDDSTEWYRTQVERGDYLRESHHDAEMSHREHGLVAEGIVKAVFPGFEWWDTESFDLFRGQTRYDIISRNINRGEPRQHYLHHIRAKKEERAKPSTNYYAVVRNHPDIDQLLRGGPQPPRLLADWAHQQRAVLVSVRSGQARVLGWPRGGRRTSHI